MTNKILFTIQGRPWTMEFIDKRQLPDCLGQTMYEEQQIEIRQDLESVTMADTVIHELIHATTGTLGLELTEQQVHQTATALTEVWANNPLLFDLIVKLIRRQQ